MKMKNNRIWSGMLFLLIAVFLIIGKLGYLEGVNLFSLLLSACLVIILLKSIFSRNFAGILFPIAFLCILYDRQLHIESLTPWTVLIAAAFGSIGLSLLFGKSGYHAKSHSKSAVSDVVDSVENDYPQHSSRFSASTKYINSEHFEQAEFNCSFCGLSVYFENAKVPNGSATVALYASFSGIELYIPKEWTVENHLQTSLAGVDEENTPSPDGSVTLHLVGSISVSGVSIIYV